MNDEEENKKICQDFADKHGIEFSAKGEVGFGRDCVGFTKNERYIDCNPFGDAPDYSYIHGEHDERLYAPDDVDAYHKHECLAVLGEGDKAIEGLANWVKSLESYGEVEIVEFKTDATGLQAMLTGSVGYAVIIKEKRQ